MVEKLFEVKRRWVLFFLAAAALGASGEPETITARELHDLQLKKSPVVLFDARGKSSYDASHIEGAVLPLPAEFYRQAELAADGLVKTPPDPQAALAESMKSVPKDTPIVTYCSRDCQASTVLYFQLKRLGFTNVRVMEEGLQSWQEKGYSMTLGAPRISSENL